MKERKSVRFIFRLTPAEFDDLKMLAEVDRKSAAEELRSWINREMLPDAIDKRLSEQKGELSKLKARLRKDYEVKKKELERYQSTLHIKG
jgi:hypothetical protein